MNDQYKNEICKLQNKINLLEDQLKKAEYLLGQMRANAMNNLNAEAERYIISYGGFAKGPICPLAIDDNFIHRYQKMVLGLIYGTDKYNNDVSNNK